MLCGKDSIDRILMNSILTVWKPLIGSFIYTELYRQNYDESKIDNVESSNLGRFL